jgi:hypothetical protein
MQFSGRVGFLRLAGGSLASFTFLRLALPCFLVTLDPRGRDPLAGWLVRRANCDQLPFAFGMVFRFFLEMEDLPCCFAHDFHGGLLLTTARLLLISPRNPTDVSLLIDIDKVV